MSNLRPLTGLLLGATLLVAACSSGAAAYAPATAAPVGSPATGVTVGAATAGALGTILTGPDGRTLYTHHGDAMNSSTCTGACLTEWPPLTVAANAQIAAAAGVTGMVGSFAGPDGSQWVTYGGMPLYYWQGDTKPGDTTGQGIAGFAVAAVAGSAAMPSSAPSQPSSAGGDGY